MVRSEFYIGHSKFQDLSDRAIDWLINSFKYESDSDEWKICRLKRRIYMREAIKHLKEANKCLLNK